MSGYVLTVPQTVELINANERLHHMVRARRTKTLRTWAYWESKRQKIPAHQQLAVEVVVYPGRRTRKLDPPNWSPSSKALIDGIVDAKVLPDDTGEHVVSVSFRGGHQRDWLRPGVELVLIPVAL